MFVFLSFSKLHYSFNCNHNFRLFNVTQNYNNNEKYNKNVLSLDERKEKMNLKDRKTYRL